MVKQYPFLPCQKQLCSQRPISVHVPLNANELCTARPSLPWGDEQFYETLAAFVMELAN